MSSLRFVGPGARLGRWWIPGLIAAVTVWTWASAAEPGRDTPPGSAADWALERTRHETRMLDDLYKNAIVLVTKHYVKSDSDLAAGEAFKVLFETMKKAGWHEVRLIDGLGSPLNESNQPSDVFEQAALPKIMNGQTTVEEIEIRAGKRYLRTATILPMVMDKCIMCHDNYRGQIVVGALGYRLPIDTPTTN